MHAESSDHSLDPNDNHVAIMSMRDSTLSIRAHHRYAVQTATKLPRLNDGTVYYCRVAFDSTDSKLAVWLTDSSEDPNTCTIEGNEQCSPMAANGSETANRELKLRGRQFVKILDTKVDLPLWIGSHDVCYVGFAAATGGLNQRHEICGWRMYSK